MMGRQTVDQSQLFYLFNLEKRIPERHLLRRIIMARLLTRSTGRRRNVRRGRWPSSPRPGIREQYRSNSEVCPVARHVRSALDTVEKVFLGRWPKFSRAADALRARRCEGPRRVPEKRPRPFVSALRRIPTVELSKDQHLRDFWGRSIFDFFNSIPSGADIVRPPTHVGFVKFAIFCTAAYNILFDRPVDGGTGALIYVQSPRYYQGSAINLPLRSSIMDIDPEEHDIMDQVNATPTPHKRLPWNKR
jgi:hypothetical protein